MRTLSCVLSLLFVTIAAPTITSADTLTYDGSLNGASESPAIASPGIGFAIVTINTLSQTMEVNVTFSGLTSPNTAAHIQCCTPAPGNAGVATVTPTFTGFPSGDISGSYDHLFDLTASTTYNPAFVTAQGSVAAAETALLTGLADGEAYLNIHTTNFPGGEIRGFLAAPATAPMPEPSNLWLLSIALLALAVAAKFKLRVS